MTVSEPGLRDRKKAATHAALRQAALRLVAERGLHGVTLEDIAAEADVSVRTFFNHFPSKEAAVVGLDPAELAGLREALLRRPEAEPPLTALREVLCELVTAVSERSREWQLRMELIERFPVLLSQLFAGFASRERALIEVIAARTGTDPDRDLYPRLAAGAAMTAFRAAVGCWRESDEGLSLHSLLQSAFAQLGAGLPDPRAHPAGSPSPSANQGGVAPAANRARQQPSEVSR